VVKWDSRSERDWRIFLNSEVALTALVDGVSILLKPRSVMEVFWKEAKGSVKLTMPRGTLVD
jgi:hypothetical protein